MSRRITGFLILVMALALVGTMSAQVLKGSISGTVVDPQGAVISGATVKAQNVDNTALSYTATSDNSGLFRFNLIPSGAYKVEITHGKDYKTLVRNNVIVSPGVDTGLGAMKMELGSMETTVEVKAEAPLVTTTEAQVSNAFAGTPLTTFAGTQENEGLDNMALFVPGVSSVRDNSFSNTNGGLGFSVNGLRGRENDQQIDGQNNNDNSVAGPALFLSNPEFVSQYVITTNNFGPEYGRNAGSVVNIITKTGQNSWHGSVFGTENNSILNTLNNTQKNVQICGTACLNKVPHLNDEFGGMSLGGPWIKSKLFFFTGFDQEIINQQSVLTSGGITPTPAGIAALSACFPGSTSIAALAKFGPYGISAGNPQPAGTISTGVVGACPAAQFATVTRTVAAPAHIFDWLLNLNLQLTNDTVTGRYVFQRNNLFNTDAFGTGAAGYTANVPDLNQQFLTSWTHNFGSRMVNEARLGFGRLNTEFGGNSLGNTIPNDGQVDQALANISFNSGANLGFGPATNSPQGRIVNTWQLQDNWNMVMGKHTLKAGVNWTYQRSPNIFLPNLNGAYRFGSWSSFAANTPNRVRVANGPSSLDFREYDTFLYVGDDWKIRQNLTLNLGLTWSYYGQPANLFNDITTKREGNPATAFWAATEPLPTGAITASCPVAADQFCNVFANPGASIPLAARTDPSIPAPKTSFGPSFGFAYNPQWGGFLTGHGKTTIRGGYRLAYDPPFYNIYLNIASAAPEVFLATIPAPSTHKLPAVPTGPNVRASLAPFIPLGTLDPREFAQTTVTPHFLPDMVHTWSFGVQRQIGNNAAFEVRYAGNAARHQFQTLDGNPYIADLLAVAPGLVPAGLTPCPASQALWINHSATPFNPSGSLNGVDPVGRLNCNEGVIRQRANTGYSNYNGLQMEFRANNLFKQLTLRSSFTWSKNLDNVSEIFSTNGGGNTNFFAQNPANQVLGAGEYSFSGLDIPNQWSLLFNEQLPFFKDQKGALGRIFGGWSLAGDYILSSGQRYTPSQFFEANCSVNPNCAGYGPFAGKDVYDQQYINSFAGFDTARPFLGNLNAPNAQVGIFAGDACNLYGVAGPLGTTDTAVSCGGTMPDTTLLSFTAMGQSCLTDATIACNIRTVTNNDVRFIVNAGFAQSVFGTPFGNVRRNIVQDEMANIANFSVFKKIKITERTAFEFHTTFLNVFNHPNFSSVDPFVSDAGLQGEFNGFGEPTMTPSTTRRIIFGGKFTF